MKLRTENGQIFVEAPCFDARFEGPFLKSFRERSKGVEFVRADKPAFPLTLTYLTGDELLADKHQGIHVKPLSEFAARVIVRGNDSDRELLIRLDPDTGDLCVRPAGQSARRGVMAVRWSIDFALDARLVLPCVNGIQVEVARPFPGNDRFPWPYRWNAQLAIAECDGVSLMIHSEDTACKFKALDLRRGERGATRLGFDSEQVGPVWDNRTAGGVEWRLNCYDGDWRAPAAHYRDWLRRTYALEDKRRHRPDWVECINFTAQWTPADLELLDALALLNPPVRTLIHLSDWRTGKYDVDYPDYKPTDAARAFVNKANAMGFKVLPHFNYFACYNQHPLFREVRDWQIRSVNRNEPEGWYWPPDTHDYTRMGFIHPGLALWRRTLINNLRAACRELGAPGAFIDQTLCTWNTDNGIVENMTTVEGMRQLQEELVQIDPAAVMAGEGMNEISFQRECFAQAHIHDGWGKLEERHVQAAHPIGSFLWEGHSRLMGYYHLVPGCTDQWHGQMELGIEVYNRMGVLPSIVVGGWFAKDKRLFAKDNPLVRRVLDLVK